MNQYVEQFDDLLTFDERKNPMTEITPPVLCRILGDAFFRKSGVPNSGESENTQDE